MNPFSTAKSLMNTALNFLPQPLQQTVSQKTEAFSFGDAVPVLDGNDLANYMQCWFNGRWYEPQVSLEGLSKSWKSTPYLSSGIIFKRNFLANLFVPHPRMSRQSFEQVGLDFIWCENTYVEDVRSRLNNTIEFKSALAKYTRAGENKGQYHCCPTNITRRTSTEVLLVYSTSYQAEIVPLRASFQINSPE